MYNYEASPVLLNIFLFLLLLYTFLPVYNGKNELNRKLSRTSDYIYAGVLIILYCTFGYADNDFYHYKDLYQSIGQEHMEPIYWWIKNHITHNSYLSWRFIVWGLATILMLWTVKRLDLDIRTSICFISIFYLMTLSIMRGNLGLSIMFLGYSYLVKPTHARTVSYIWGTVLIAISYFFHSSMILSIAMLAVTPLKLNKKTVIISLVLFPVFVGIVTNFLTEVISGGLAFNNDMMNTGETLQSYAERDMSVSNINGKIAKSITYLPIFVSMIYITYKVVFQKIQLPKHIHCFFVYWYAMTYFASLFYFQETSQWLYIRFMMMAYFPMTVVLTHYYSTCKTTRMMKLIMLLALLACAYKLSYVIYSRL